MQKQTIHLPAKMIPGFAMASYCPKSDFPMHSEPQPASLYPGLHSQLIPFQSKNENIPLTHTPPTRKKLKRQD